MKSLPTRPAGRVALMLMLIALLLTVCVAVYVFLERRLRPLVPRGKGAELTRETFRTELTVLLAILLGASLLILIFVVGAYLFIRIGRAVSQQKVGGEPTDYVNVWGQYRLTPEQIEAATQERPDSDERSGPPEETPRDPHPTS